MNSCPSTRGVFTVRNGEQWLQTIWVNKLVCHQLCELANQGNLENSTSKKEEGMFVVCQEMLNVKI